MSRRAYANELPHAESKLPGSSVVSVALTRDTSYLCRAEPLFALLFVKFGYCSLFQLIKRTFAFGADQWQLPPCASITCLSAFVVCFVFLLFIYIIRFKESYIQWVKLVSH